MGCGQHRTRLQQKISANSEVSYVPLIVSFLAQVQLSTFHIYCFHYFSIINYVCYYFVLNYVCSLLHIQHKLNMYRYLYDLDKIISLEMDSNDFSIILLLLLLFLQIYHFLFQLYSTIIFTVYHFNYYYRLLLFRFCLCI